MGNKPTKPTPWSVLDQSVRRSALPVPRESMAKRLRGRPANLEKKMNNADHVSLRVMRDRSLARMGPFKGVDHQGRQIKNTLSGKRLKGQQRSPRSMGKDVLPEVAAELGVSPRTLERQHAEHGEGALSRISAEIVGRLRKADKGRQEQAKAKAERERPLVEKLNRIAKRMQRQPLRKVSRKK